MIDFERGAKTTGSKFYFLTGTDARRELDLINRMVAFHEARGYEFVIPPFLINKQCAQWAGILDRFDAGYYETTDGKILVPTAEHPMVGFHANEIFQEDTLPKKYVALSPCFRKEAGTYGSRDRGLRRVHQFHKIELFVVCRPDQSETLHQEMVQQVCDLLNDFGVEFRTVELSVNDRSPVSNKTIDVEVKCGEEWLEVSSISNCGDNQSKKAMIRYKPKKGGKPVKVHLLNGSGVALPRLTLALTQTIC